MADGDAKRSHVRIAAAILAALVLAAAVFTYLSYTAAFTSTDTVTVTVAAGRPGDGERRQGQVPRHPDRQGHSRSSTPATAPS